MTEVIPEPEWSTWATGDAPTVLKVWDGAPTLFLAPTTRGSIVWWEFDQGADNSRYILLAHLSDSEAQAVFDAPPMTGALEAVRAHMEDDRAIIARRHPDGCDAERLIRIPKTAPETEFSALLDDVQADLAREDLPHPHHRRKAAPGAHVDRRHGEDSMLDSLARLVSA